MIEPVTKTTLGACVHMPVQQGLVALFSLTVFFFCFRSVTALWSSMSLFAVQIGKLTLSWEACLLGPLIVEVEKVVA